MPLSCLSSASPTGTANNLLCSRDPWLVFNRQLNRLAVAFPNEADFCLALKAAQRMGTVKPLVYWLTVSRIAELAIKLAGDYADNGEVRAAGDLLVNPRRIDVYLRGQVASIQKDRHRGLSEQFAAAIGDEDPAVWLKRETQLRIKSKALLPHLKDLLSSSGLMASDYLDGVERRLCRIADTIGFMCARGRVGSRCMRVPGDSLLLDVEDRELIAANQCHFSDRRFLEMGKEIERMILYGGHYSRFLSLPL